MPRTWALITLGAVLAVFLLGLLDVSLNKHHADSIMRIAAVILSGVAIGAILAGLDDT